MDQQSQSIEVEEIRLQYNLQEDRLLLSDHFTLPVISVFLRAFFKLMKSYDYPVLFIDLDGLSGLDSAGVTALQYLKNELQKKGIELIYNSALKISASSTARVPTTSPTVNAIQLQSRIRSMAPSSTMLHPFTREQPSVM